MKLSRDEFKEYVELYKTYWDKVNELIKYYNENTIDELVWPIFDWIDKKAGLKKDDEYDFLSDYYVFGGVPIPTQIKELPNGEIECDYEETTDLDKIYDYYLGGN